MSIRLGKIMGIPIRIHYTLWFVFIVFAWSLAVGCMPRQYPGLSAVTYWAIGLASAIILFASILAHELSHSYVAKKNGLPDRKDHALLLWRGLRDERGASRCGFRGTDGSCRSLNG
jgi:hypothetical protein